MQEKLDAMFNDIDGLTAYALVNESTGRVMRELAPLREVAYALGQMACLVGIGFKLRLQRAFQDDQWHIAPGMFEDANINELLNAISEPESMLVYAAMYAAYEGRWPTNAYDLIGWKSTRNGMCELTRIAGSARWVFVSDATGHTASSIKKLCDAALKHADGRGVVLHNAALLHALRENLGYCHLMTAHRAETGRGVA
ncbi:hypothetical protein AB4Y45_32560 [Paraburkholderia sp. EG287A]|uniref:hypothetical protein n=1 Tax=Paraburkholderia sp. EG287A TaxID=3237012 RepID=UPI0034D1C672